MTTSVDDFLDGYIGPVEEVPICGKPGLIAEFERVESEIIGHRAQGGLAGPPAELQVRLDEILAEIEASVLVVRLRGLSFGPWLDLQAQHPPTSAEKALGHGVHAETFEPAALAACAVEPVFTTEQAARTRDTIAATEWRALLSAIRRLHGEGGVAPKSLLLSALLRPSGGSSTTPPSTESPDHGSLADPGEQSPPTSTTTETG